MSEEWGPWIEHDGGGFPVDLAWRYIQATFLLACEDEWGGHEGSERHQEFIVNDEAMTNPMWHHENFGQGFHYTTGPFAGRMFFSAKVMRYRVRKPRALVQLRKLAEELPERVDA